MNTAQLKAIQNAINYEEDNLYRYKLQAAREPGYVTGNGETVESVIVNIQKRISELKEPIK